MSPMTLKHTKSPSGRTHQLTDPKTGQAVTKHYATTPQYDDQVQGDLIREFSRTIFPVVIGRLPVHIDPDLLDKGQKPHSLEYLRGYLAGLEIARGQGQQRNRDAIEEVREKIAKLEAQRGGLSLSEIAQGGPVNGGGFRDDGSGFHMETSGIPPFPLPQVQVNVVQPPFDAAAEIARRDRMRRRTERNRW